MSLVTSISELKKGKWYHSPNLWAIDRPNAVEMSKENTEFIQRQIDKKILFTTEREAVEQGLKILQFIDEKPKASVKVAFKIDDNLDLFGETA